MFQECRYVSKKEVKIYKEIIELTIPKVKKDVKEKFGKSFGHQIVGSARRNLVVQKGNSHWDVDYQFIFLARTFNQIEGPDLKEFIKNSFSKHLGKKYSVKMSTSVITICLLDDERKNAKKSFDIALLKINEETKNKEILRGKSNDKNSNYYIKWEELPNSKKLYDARLEINGPEMWEKLREIFLKKKKENMDKLKDEQKETFSIYLESIQETLDLFDIE